MAICPEAMFGMMRGIRNGETRRTVCAARLKYISSTLEMPPMPTPTMTPVRSGAASGSGRPASSTASSAAPTVYWMKMSIFFKSLRSMKRSGSKSRTSPATRAGRAEASKRVIGPMPERPATRLSQFASMPVPSGVTRPSPVTTTRRRVPFGALKARNASAARGGVKVALDARPVIAGSHDEQPAAARRHHIWHTAAHGRLPLATRDRRLRPGAAPARHRHRHALRLHPEHRLRRDRLRHGSTRHAGRSPEDARRGPRRAVLLDLRGSLADRAGGLLRRGAQAVRRRPRDDPGEPRHDRMGQDRRRRPGQRRAQAHLGPPRRGRRARPAAGGRGGDARAPAHVSRARRPLPDPHLVHREPARRLLGRRQRRPGADRRRSPDHRRDGASRHDGRCLARLRSALLGRHPLRAKAGHRLPLLGPGAGERSAQHERRHAAGGGAERRRGVRELRLRLSRPGLLRARAGRLGARARARPPAEGAVAHGARGDGPAAARAARATRRSHRPRRQGGGHRSRLPRERLRRGAGDAGGAGGHLQAPGPHRRATPARLRPGRRREDPRRQRAAGARGQRAAGEEPTMSGRARVVVIEGEDAAPEAVRPTVALVDRLGLPIDWVRPAVEDHDATRRAIDASDAALFGATSGRSAAALFYLRWGKATYANVRPARWLPGYRSPLARPEGIDLVIVRENLEDLYVGVEGELAALRPLALSSPMMRRPVADLGPGRFALKVITEEGSARVVRFAFELARRRKAAGRPGKLTCATKHNMLPGTDGLFRDVATRLAAAYPDIRFETFIVDDFARRLVAEPQALDVVVLPNLYGDTLSDAAAGVIGGLGLAPSGCHGAGYAYFEPAHGSAPDIAGKGIINPTATILSAALMLDYLACAEAARRLEAAVEHVYADGRPLTPDQGGTATTLEFAAAVERYFR